MCVLVLWTKVASALGGLMAASLTFPTHSVRIGQCFEAAIVHVDREINCLDPLIGFHRVRGFISCRGRKAVIGGDRSR